MREFHSDAPDFLRRPSDQERCFVRRRGSVFLSGKALTAERVVIKTVDHETWRAKILFGYLEVTDVPAALKPVMEQKLKLPREIVCVVGSERNMPRVVGLDPLSVLLAIFSFMAGNSVRTVDRFGLPGASTLEIGHRVKLWEPGTFHGPPGCDHAIGPGNVGPAVIN